MTNEETDFENHLAIVYLADISKILGDYHRELTESSDKEILVELANRISYHFYGDVE